MPSSGYGCGPELDKTDLAIFDDALERASEWGMQAEWLGCLVAAIQQGASFWEACNAGLEEWDL